MIMLLGYVGLTYVGGLCHWFMHRGSDDQRARWSWVEVATSPVLIPYRMVDQHFLRRFR